MNSIIIQHLINTEIILVGISWREVNCNALLSLGV